MALTKTPIELSSTPSIVDGGNATAITIDSSERVGINETAPSEKLHIGASGADDSNAIKIDGTNGASQTFGFILQADGENARVSFKVGQGNNTPTQELMIHPDGGICFGTDTAAANALDDYEEGTWTPTIRRINGTVAASVGSITNASYTKIGNTVNVNAYFNNISAGSSNGSSYWVIFGIPFSSNVVIYTGGILAYNSTSANTVYVGDASGNAILCTNTAPLTGSLSGEFMFNITYRVS